MANSSVLLSFSIPFSLTIALAKSKKLFSRNGITLALLLVAASAVLGSEQFWASLPLTGAVDPNQEIQLTLEPRNAVAFPASDIYVVNGRAYAHINELVNLMGSHGLLFYMSGTSGVNQGSDGLIARDDVILIKINCQWDERGGTNTDLLKELVQMIVDHPDGFVGEIVVADNGQAQSGSFGNGGSLNWTQNNAEDHSQSAQDVVDMFSASYNVSTYLWDTITLKSVAEYAEGDMNDGYIINQTAHPVTGINVSYPKFKTKFGTYISFKNGIWEPVTGSYDTEKLKLINFPVLKSHTSYGVTESVKHYMGVVSARQTNAHVNVGTGGMGTEMVETRLPTLSILDAIWVNANPAPSSSCGPRTRYEEATRVNVVIASTDPVALDYWGSKYVLVQAAELIGYTDTHTMNPDSTDPSGTWGPAFGVWLNLSKNEIIAGGYNVTTDEDQMNIYVNSDSTSPYISTPVQNPQRDNVTAGQEVKVTVNVTDAESGVKNVTLFYTVNNATTWENQTMNYNTSTSLYEATIPGQPGGTWVKFKIVAYDNSGNNATKDGAEPYCTYRVIPEPPPNIVVFSPENKTYSVDSVPLSFTVEETTIWMGYSLNGQANVTITGNTTLFDLSDGSHDLVVYANDTAGHMSSSGTVYFTIDTTEPSISILSPENKTYDTTGLPLNFTIDESVSWMGYTLDGQANVTIVGNTPLASLLDGWHHVVVYANDTAGNMGASEPVYFTVDTSSPNISAVSQSPLKNNVLPEDEVEVNATVTDDLSGVRRVTLKYTNGNGTWIIVDMTNVEGNIWNGAIPNFSSSTIVTYVIEAEDNVNNSITTEEMGYEYQYQVISEFPWGLVLLLLVVSALIIGALSRKLRSKPVAKTS